MKADQKLGRKIAKWLLILILFTILGITIVLQAQHPEWFLIQGSKVGNQLVETPQPKGPPREVCTLYECHWTNLPADKPYITQTRWYWLYEYQFSILFIVLLIGIYANWDTVQKWKSMFLKSD